MNEKKRGKSAKVLLICAALALVVVISVNITLAYLTAVTEKKENIFKAKQNITGMWVQPCFENGKTYYISPGSKIIKDPLVLNTTKNKPIYVGAKMTFSLNIGYGDIDVDYDTFTHYVTIEGLMGDNWESMDGSVASVGKNKWYFYNDVLEAFDENIPAYNSLTKTVDYYGGAGDTDNTTYLFTGVTVNKDIRIADLSDSTKYVENNQITKDFDYGINTVFKDFKFKIRLESYGVDADGITAQEAKKGIIVGLGGTWKA